MSRQVFWDAGRFAIRSAFELFRSDALNEAGLYGPCFFIYGKVRQVKPAGRSVRLAQTMDPESFASAAFRVFYGIGNGSYTISTSGYGASGG